MKVPVTVVLTSEIFYPFTFLFFLSKVQRKTVILVNKNKKGNEYKLSQREFLLCV